VRRRQFITLLGGAVAAWPLAARAQLFTLVADPVASGLVASLAHPGANITGFTNYEYAIGGKWLEALKESATRITRVLAIQNPENAGAPGLLREIEAGAHSFGVQVATASTLDAAEMERAIEAFAHEPNGGLIVLPDATTSNLRASLVALTARHRLPAIYPFRYFAASGGLMSYGIDTADPFRRAADKLPWALRTRIDETAIIDSTGFFWMEFLRRRRAFWTFKGAPLPESCVKRPQIERLE
jgi:putative tryptophan/tyrosine transport system substrate-binding protein